MPASTLHTPSTSELVANGGSGLAVGGGIFAALFASTEASTPALVVAYAGLVTAIGSQGFTFVRLWVDERKDARKAREGLQDLLSRLDAKRERISHLEAQDREKQQRIDFLEHLIDHNNRRLNELVPIVEEHGQAIARASDSGPILIIKTESPPDGGNSSP